MDGHKLMRSRVREEAGSSLIETALVLPIMLLLTFGLIDLCLILLGVGGANYGSRVALRYASLHSNASYAPSTQAQLTAILKQFILPYPTNTYSLNETFYTGIGMASPSGPGNNVGMGVAVTVNISYQFVVMGATFRPFSYSTTCASVIVQ